MAVLEAWRGGRGGRAPAAAAAGGGRKKRRPFGGCGWAGAQFQLFVWWGGAWGGDLASSPLASRATASEVPGRALPIRRGA